MPHDFAPPAYDAPIVAVQSERFVDRSKSAWGHCEELGDLTPLNSPQSTGLFINESWATDDCVCMQQVMDGNSHVHEAKHFEKSGNIVFVSRLISGQAMGRTGDSPYSIYRGSISIRDYSRPFDGIQTAAVTQGIFFLHDTVGFDPGQHPNLNVYHHGSQTAQALNAAFDMLFGELGAGLRRISSVHIARIKSCVKLALQGEAAKADVRTIARQALKHVICSKIEQNLSDYAYSPKTILSEFGTSRATLFRMFEADGGVRNYIRNRRLYRAVLQISQTPMTRGAISRAAREWGFSSDANFNRSVRRFYGTSPNSLFEAPIPHVPIPEGSRSIWMRQRAQIMQRADETLSAFQYV